MAEQIDETHDAEQALLAMLVALSGLRRAERRLPARPEFDQARHALTTAIANVEGAVDHTKNPAAASVVNT